VKTPVREVKDDPRLSTAALAMRIVDAACRLRDFDWETDDPGPTLDALDLAVDASRARLLSCRLTPPPASL
jgi:hypothetical protein